MHKAKNTIMSNGQQLNNYAYTLKYTFLLYFKPEIIKYETTTEHRTIFHFQQNGQLKQIQFSTILINRQKGKVSCLALKTSHIINNREDNRNCN